MNVLAFDTSQTDCSIALKVGEQFYVQHECVPRMQAQTMLGMIEGLLSEAQLTVRDLDLIVFGCGPGSFTGIRLATSVAQGLALGAECQVSPVSCLQCMAQVAHDAWGDERALVAIDARMEEVYFGAYAWDESQGLMLGEDGLCPPSALVAPFSGDFGCVGNAWAAYPGLLPGSVESKQREGLLPCAQTLIKIALKLNNSQPPETVLPTYLRDKVAKSSADR